MSFTVQLTIDVSLARQLYEVLVTLLISGFWAAVIPMHVNDEKLYNYYVHASIHIAVHKHSLRMPSLICLHVQY